MPIFAAALDPSAKDLRELELPESCAFAIGNEFRLSQLRQTGRQATIIGIVQALFATLLVDLALLRDVLEALPDARACWTTPSAPLVFTAPNGQALLCPVKPVGNAGATRSAAPFEIEQPAAQRHEIISKPRT